jgi:hypothetical protein
MADFCGIEAKMTENSQHLSNQPAEMAADARRPGRPRGIPKPAGSGRKKGTPNKVTADIKALALKRAPAMLKELERLATEGKDERTRLAAVIEWLNRAVGRPMTPSEVTGKDGAPLIVKPEMSNLEHARRIAFVLSKAAREAGVPIDVFGDGRDAPKPVAQSPRPIVSPPIPSSPSPPAEPTPAAAEAVNWYAAAEERLRPDQRNFGAPPPNVVRMRPR